MPAASSAMFGARRVEARASPPRGPRAPETRQRDLSRRVSSPSPHRRRGASRPALGEPKSATLASLPAHFDLDTAILLAGFAFEAYASPEGGTRDEDTRGGATAYVGDFARDVFAGVLEVRVRSARGLPRADALGASDPYVVLSVGGGDDGYGYGRPKSSARTSTKKNTLNPRWGDDDDGRCVMCARRDPRAQTLTLDVYDEDRLPGKKDDFLGTATVCFADLVEDAIASTPSGAGSALGGFAAAIGKMPGFQSRRRECLGVALQGGPGGGTVDFSLTFTPLSAPAREVASAGLKRTAALLREAEKNVANAAEPRTKTSEPAGTGAAGTKKNTAFAARAASVVAREAARRLDAIEAEYVREQNESSSWAMRARNDWSVLATERENGENDENGATRKKKTKNASNPGSPPRSPKRFSKACFVEDARTDTQCAVWRSRRDRTVVVAFRGTEMDRPLDFFTDVNFKPAPFEALAERGGEVTRSAEAAAAEVRAPRVHGGFLRAYESVRARVFAAVDDVIAAETHAREDDHDARDDTWHVFVTGHSLGGALATLFACELGQSASGPGPARDVTVTMYNFGSPRVGDGAFCDAYNALVPDSVRVVNRADLVPTLPALLGYRHVERGVRVSVGGDGAAEIAPFAAARGTERYGENGENGENGEDGENGSAQASASAASAARNIVRLAERLGVVGSLGVDAETAADAAEALSSLASLDALADHFEDEYLVALRAARKT